MQILIWKNAKIEGLYEYLNAVPFWIANDMVKKLAYFFPHVNSIQTYTLFPRPVNVQIACAVLLVTLSFFMHAHQH